MNHYVGLALFVQVIVLDVIGLLLDLYSWSRGRPTITGTVRRYPLLGIPILFLQLVGAAGLGMHFYLGD